MSPRNTRTGDVLEQMVLPALDLGGYTHKVQVERFRWPTTKRNRLAHKFFIQRLQSLEPFTKEEVTAATGWDSGTLETYWSKQFKNILEPVEGTNQYRSVATDHLVECNSTTTLR